jgi:hypothetical protein
MNVIHLSINEKGEPLCKTVGWSHSTSDPMTVSCLRCLKMMEGKQLTAREYYDKIMNSPQLLKIYLLAHSIKKG